MREDKLPLRVILQNFVNHVESLENVKEEHERDEKYEHEFQDLKKLTESLKNHPDFASTEGEKECNRRKNRYKDILPYDRTRVVLQPFPGIPGSDYINANYIRGASGSKAYIASQGPLPQTVPDFWRMVVECDVQVIVMASNETEGGKHKCECYWISTEGEEKQFGNVTVTFVKSRQVCPDFLVRTLKIRYLSESNKMEERTICQFHYMLWPDHGVPDAVRPLLDMVRLVRDCQASETLPVLIHCSAGCGRTGTICAIDYVWGLLRTGKLSVNLNLLALVREMRVQRVAMVQTKEQYMLLYHAVKELFRERLSLIDSHPYENISTDGNPIKEKESDYEELFVSHEKQDKSIKIITPCTSSSSTTPSSSLTRIFPKHQSLEIIAHKDNLRRTASATNLTAYHGSNKSGLVFHPTLVDSQGSLSSNVSSKSEDQVMKISNKLLIIPTRKSQSQTGLSSSKLEKEAENIAQREESKVQSEYENKGSRKAILHSPSSFKQYFPNQIPKKCLFPPVPPPRSRTPSPIISIKKAIERKCPQYEKNKNSTSEFTRRPSIKKLRELFEKQPANAKTGNSSRGAKIVRSVSSVTTRPTTLSLNDNHSFSLKLKRKGSLGSDKLVSHPLSLEEKLLICPPPPSCPDKKKNDEFNDDSLLSTPRSIVSCKPPSSPTFSRVRKKQKEENVKISEERPALPIKKSKSFRWSRPQGMGALFKSTSRSPDISRKKTDTYFKLDKLESSFSSNIAKSEENLKKLTTDIPLPNEGLRLSVYSQIGSCKPEIPPKKSVRDKFGNPSPQTAESFHKTPANDEKFNPLNIYSSPQSVNKTISRDSGKLCLTTATVSKDYANSKFPIPSDCEQFQKNINAPIPTKRVAREKKVTNHEYVNCNVVIISEDDDTGSDIANVSDSSMRITASTNDHDANFQSGLQDSLDYEPVDFGESSNHVDEVFETINYEIFNKSDAQVSKDPSKSNTFQNYYLNRELDSIAIEVYKDCQDYLLHGSNKCRVPSLLPTDNNAVMLSNESMITDLEEVRNKVAVPPQGLRNRERRNSYRQAVSSTPYGNKGTTVAHKAIHKYEKIWFENGRENYCDNELFLANMGASGGFSDDTIPAIDCKKLNDLSEEEISSRDSGSTSSLLSSEKFDGARILRPRLPSPNKSLLSSENLKVYSNITLAGASSSVPHTSSNSSLTNINSQYGTLATTTSKPYKSKIYSSENIYSDDVSGKQINASTLPIRSYMSNSNIGSTMAASYSSPIKYEENSEYLYGYSCPQNKKSANDSYKIPKTGIHSTFQSLGEGNEPRLSKFVKKYNDHAPATTSHRHQQGSVSSDCQPKHPLVTKSSFCRNDRNEDFHLTKRYEQKKNTQNISHGKISSEKRSLGFKELNNHDNMESSNHSSRHKLTNIKSCSEHPTPATRFYVNQPLSTSPTRFSGIETVKSMVKEDTLPTDIEEKLSIVPPALNQNFPSTGFKKLFKGSKNSEIPFQGSTSPVHIPSRSELSNTTSEKSKVLTSTPASIASGSPRPLTKAFSKFKTGSRNVAQNLRSYLKGTTDDSGKSLQKSPNYGPSFNVFTEIVHDSVSSTSIPKNPYGNQEENYHSDDLFNRGKSKPRSQYL